MPSSDSERKRFVSHFVCLKNKQLVLPPRRKKPYSLPPPLSRKKKSYFRCFQGVHLCLTEFKVMDCIPHVETRYLKTLMKILCIKLISRASDNQNMRKFININTNNADIPGREMELIFQYFLSKEISFYQCRLINK